MSLSRSLRLLSIALDVIQFVRLLVFVRNHANSLTPRIFAALLLLSHVTFNVVLLLVRIELENKIYHPRKMSTVAPRAMKYQILVEGFENDL